jgi:hypothetical protein
MDQIKSMSSEYFSFEELLKIQTAMQGVVGM